jgi:hypothetical protein
MLPNQTVGRIIATLQSILLNGGTSLWSDSHVEKTRFG